MSEGQVFSTLDFGCFLLFEFSLDSLRFYELSNFFLKRLEFDNQKSRLTNQLDYEGSLDTYQNVKKWKEMISSDEENIKQHKQEEKKAMKVSNMLV